MKKGTIDNYMITLLRYACTIIGAALIGNAFGNMNAGRPKQGLKLVVGIVIFMLSFVIIAYFE